MSFTAEGWAWEQEAPSSAAKAVLTCLGWFADKEGEQAFPSIGTICRRTQHAERTVRKALAELIAAGMISRHERTSKTGRCMSAEYRLNIREPTLANLQGVKASGPPPTPSKSTRGTLANLPGNPSLEPVSKEESKIPPLPPPRGGRARVNEPDGFAEFYASYPRKVGRPSAARAFTAAIARGVDPTAIIDGLARYRFSPEPRYRPHPATWLNDDRWASESEHPDAELMRIVGLTPEDFEAPDMRPTLAVVGDAP